MHSPRAAELPVLSPIAEIRPQRVALHVAEHCEQVLVLFNRKRFETPLVKMARSLGSIISVPAHRMGVRQPAEEVGELLVCFRADDEVPVIRHDTIGENRQGLSLERLLQNTLEGLIVFLLLEQRQSSHRAVKHVEANIIWANARSLWHES